MFESAGYAHWCRWAFRYRCRPVRWPKPGPAAGEQDFIGVPVARALGLTGKGVDVGVIDGGFLPQHPAFAGQAITPLANRVAIDGEEAIADPSRPLFDRDEQSGEIQVASHGANVSGIIAARPEVIADFTYRGGVAPKVGLFQTQIRPSDEADDEDADIEEEQDEAASQASLLQPGSEELVHGALSTLYRGAPTVRIINNSYNDDPYRQSTPPRWMPLMRRSIPQRRIPT
ncbi:S8 family serine peptidase [Pseudomonas aeruginosa]|nr:S8 family serine peptidase [Pseudomonas aeruginosa]